MFEYVGGSGAWRCETAIAPKFASIFCDGSVLPLSQRASCQVEQIRAAGPQEEIFKVKHRLFNEKQHRLFVSSTATVTRHVCSMFEPKELASLQEISFLETKLWGCSGSFLFNFFLMNKMISEIRKFHSSFPKFLISWVFRRSFRRFVKNLASSADRFCPQGRLPHAG